MNIAILNLLYLLAAVFFILAFKMLSSPRRAIFGNLIGSIGMFIAVIATVLYYGFANISVVISGIAIGGLIGAIMALKVPMTAMPQMVAILNGLGGGASMLVSGISLIESIEVTKTSLSMDYIASVIAGGIIGAVTLSGSMVAAAKLQWHRIERPIMFRGIHIVTALLLALSILFGVLIPYTNNVNMFWLMSAIALVLGIFLVLPIGGADMPVVISLLNSYSGLAAAATGFVLRNTMLIIAGSLVGTSGIILTNLMCKAMNRSFINVLLGGFGSKVIESQDIYQGKIKRASAEDVAELLRSARKVVIVPGYGMAVAQAHYPLKELVNILESMGIEVDFAIHPVAGRMPGHMNVLLAEAGIPYEKMKGLEEINPIMEQVDVAIVVGANDIVNPYAETDPKSPIYGMPIVQVYKAKTVVVIKRSLAPGFAGIPNPLFTYDNTLMYFEDARKAILDIIAELKSG
ncbi:NAD(P)(+) transhydrogenase (AB-specific) [Ignisphaera aggregans DSM 17230]|uniref:NAD(P) transhydrogenase subunit beta n=1 Tax=Ignisphaera aggregans (strain DSM 17230 / JCM 13409 / AQ1.S1) TaxID=583356 RepID=E0SNM4_IGNAA|nr:NAD(P)(+) transhydrogenase (AB-specific) [Ignisphaera aggregans DSM 17230]